jgi:hypothetical protein
VHVCNTNKSPNISPKIAKGDHVFSLQDLVEEFPQLNSNREDICNILDFASNGVVGQFRLTKWFFLELNKK